MTVRQWVVLVLSAIVSLSLSACSLPQVKAEDRLFQDITLEFLGETVVPRTLEVDKTPVGGLSGITYSPKDDVFYAVSDDRSTKAPARFYRLKLDLDASGKPIATKFTAVTTLKNATVVPDDAVQRGTEGLYAFAVASDNKAELRKIKVSRSIDGRSVVDEGLSPGERVIVAGQYRVQPGSTVVTKVANSEQVPAKAE